jgi:hypothetical protein
MKTASDFYLAFLPLLNAGRVELLDSPRLINQLAALERHRGRGGRDTIDHPPGSHDDAACAAAGALVLASTDAVPGLIRQSDFITDAEVDGRKIATIFATLIIDPDGRCGLAYFSAVYPHLRDLPLTVLDFEQPRMTADLFRDVSVRLDQLAEHYREIKRDGAPHALLFVPQVYQPRALASMGEIFGKYAGERRKVLCEPLEGTIDLALLADPVRMHFAASVHFSDGKVKFAAAARERMTTLPINVTGAFGDHHDPVTLALWAGSVLQFEGAAKSSRVAA